jgi:hypothetical protein
MSSSAWGWTSDPSVRIVSARAVDDEYLGINISRIRVGGDLGGVVFGVGMVTALLYGMPAARGFFAAALAGGAALALVVGWWHRRHAHPTGDALIRLALRRR